MSNVFGAGSGNQSASPCNGQIADDTLRPANTHTQQVWDAAGRHLVSARWWETAAALKVVTLKQGRSFGFEMSMDPAQASRELDEVSAEGFQAIEVFAPAYGHYAYSGLDTVDHYRIDPELGSMDDFRHFVRLAHLKGIAVTAFINIGYFSVDAPDWHEACDDKRAGKDSDKVKWFLWSDTVDAPFPPTQEDKAEWVTDEYRDSVKTWGWQYSERAQAYFWARWHATDPDGEDIPLPQNNWAAREWREEAERIVRFWMDTGLDGLVIDAPISYLHQTWKHNRHHITSVVKSYGNAYVQPEGGKGIAWLEEAGYNGLQEYGIRSWEEGKLPVDNLLSAIQNGDSRPMEKSLHGSHDPYVSAGGSLYLKVREMEDDAERHLQYAVVAGIGDMLAFIRDVGNPDSEETWILKTKAIHPALHQQAIRRVLPTNADDKYYAFLKTAVDGSERVLVVLNFKNSPEMLEVDLDLVQPTGLVELRTGQLIEPVGLFEPFKVELPAFGYQFYQVLT